MNNPLMFPKNANLAITLSALAMIVTSTAFAGVHDVRPGDVIKDTISSKEVNRIAFEGDRIKSLFKSDGDFTYDNDEQTGEIFIRPERDGSRKPLSFFVTTEQGGTYQLLLTPADVPSASVVLRPVNLNMAEARAWEGEAPYQQTLAALLKAIVTGQPPKGYVQDFKTENLRLGDFLVARRVARMEGANYRATAFRIVNQSSEPAEFSENQLFRSGVLAVSISAPVIPAKGQISAYLIEAKAQQ